MSLLTHPCRIDKVVATWGKPGYGSSSLYKWHLNLLLTSPYTIVARLIFNHGCLKFCPISRLCDCIVKHLCTARRSQCPTLKFWNSIGDQRGCPSFKFKIRELTRGKDVGITSGSRSWRLVPRFLLCCSVGSCDNMYCKLHYVFR